MDKWHVKFKSVITIKAMSGEIHEQETETIWHPIGEETVRNLFARGGFRIIKEAQERQSTPQPALS